MRTRPRLDSAGTARSARRDPRSPASTAAPPRGREDIRGDLQMHTSATDGRGPSRTWPMRRAPWATSTSLSRTTRACDDGARARREAAAGAVKAVDAWNARAPASRSSRASSSTSREWEARSADDVLAEAD